MNSSKSMLGARQQRTKHMVEVMEAYVRGEQIQRRNNMSSTSPWEDCRHPSWLWHVSDYRVRPEEPRRFWINEYGDGGYGSLHSSIEGAVADAARWKGVQLIELVEVL